MRSGVGLGSFQQEAARLGHAESRLRAYNSARRGQPLPPPALITQDEEQR